MQLDVILPLMEGSRNFKKLCQSLTGHKSTAVAAPAYLRSYLLAGLISRLKRPVLIVSPTTDRAKRLVQDISCFLGEGRVYYFPDWETLPYEPISPSQQAVSQRLEILHYLTQAPSRPISVVAAVQTVLHRLVPRERNLHRPLNLEVGQEIDRDLAVERLVGMGYQRQECVEARGEFSIRGGLVDIFPPTQDLPLRVEFAYDKIESIRLFRVADQRSVSSLKQAAIFGCLEVSLDPPAFRRAVSWLQDKVLSSGEEASLGRLRSDLERLQELHYFEGLEQYLPLMEKRLETLLDYFPKEGLIAFDETRQVLSEARRHYGSQQEFLEEEKTSLPATTYFLSPKELTAAPHQRLELISLKTAGDWKEAEFISESVEPMLGSRERLKQIVSKLAQDNYTQVVAFHDQGQAKRFKEVAAELGFYPQVKEFVLGKLNVATGDFSKGFIWPEIKLALFSYGDIFIAPRPHRQREEKTAMAARPLVSLADLKIGDYVVHTSHGIACYEGLVREKIGDGVWECLVLRYADGTLKVRADQMDKVSKYMACPPSGSRRAGGEAKPKLSFLNKKGWLRTKRRVRASVKKIALSLFKLYLERAQAQGIAFSPDAPWQRELEESFSYEETSDQLQAISEVKADMETPWPMDRLVCGDVGYGKTEVALRAAFKAVMDGKQVLVLAPTTILAQQHLNTFEERLAPFPVFVEMLSRFRSPSQQKKVIEALEKGQADIVIGTHRLLQKDVRPKDLGLVIVDEEQRFGVMAKEHLKSLKKSVDVLTLSATPIPRTLQMSLSGIRDLSIINTAPEDRFPIMTYVGEYDQQLVKMAIRRELHRGGQIYYVHNQVQTIYQKAKLIEGLVPEARVAVAHGQMPEHDLEKVMLSFLAQKLDILVCTTIIESGIDIPAVNTLIVEEADRFGLAQLYQLRGRVGRSDRRAFAYFFFSPASLTTNAGQRLSTISELTELGSGFKIALRDLEIRGAGNFLGPEQHGCVAAVGFDLYCQMLNQAVSDLEGKVTIKSSPVKIDLPVRAYLPTSYVDSESLRLEVYSRIVSAKNEKEIEGEAKELKDRYGKLPAEARNLLRISKVKLLAEKAGVGGVSYLRGKIILWPLQLNQGQLEALKLAYPGIAYKNAQKSLVTERLAPKETVTFLLKLLSDIIEQLSYRKGRRK